jgi:hypothetical protein
VPVPLPVGTRLLHIGPHKTGTTFLQGALHNSRKDLTAHGVHYVGHSRQQRAAAMAVVRKAPLPGQDESTMASWPRLVREVKGSTAGRVVISSETFANAAPQVAGEIAEAFGPQTHVVITLRPLVKLLPSQWQQYVQSWMTTDYETWLDGMLNHPDTSTLTPSFWVRHRHDELVRRWADVVGTERVTVIALDESDRGMVLRSFESLLDLPAGLLVPDGKSNRSLTLPEAELAREISRQFREQGWPRGIHEKYVRFALYDRLKARPAEPGAPAIVTPTWAVERADAIAAEIISGIQSSGVEVIGDLSHLRVPATGTTEMPVADSVSVAVAAHAVISTLDATVVGARDRGGTTSSRGAKDVIARVSDTPFTELLRTAAAKTRRRLRRHRDPRPTSPATTPTASDGPADPDRR